MSLPSASYVVFSGNIGTGKTTLAHLVAQRYGLVSAPETVERLSFVNDFFADMPGWAFRHQLDFLLLKAEQERWISKIKTGVCQDRSFDECFNVFASQFYADGWISPREWLLLERLRSLITEDARTPDLIVFLSAPLEVLLERIVRRGRKYELDILPEWLRRLDILYEKWLPKQTVPVLHIDTGQHDLLADNQREIVFNLIDGAIAETYHTGRRNV